MIHLLVGVGVNVGLVGVGVGVEVGGNNRVDNSDSMESLKIRLDTLAFKLSLSSGIQRFCMDSQFVLYLHCIMGNKISIPVKSVCGGGYGLRRLNSGSSDNIIR